MSSSVFTPTAKLLAILGGSEKPLSKTQATSEMGKKQIRAISLMLTSLVEDGSVTIDSTLFCPKCGERIEGSMVEKGDARIVLTEKGRVRAQALNSTMRILSETHGIKETEVPKPMKPEPKKPENGNITAKQVTELRVPLGTCPVCRKGKLLRGACDSCEWDEAEGITCPKGLVKPLEKVETCMDCVIFAPTDEQPCQWVPWIQ